MTIPKRLYRYTEINKYEIEMDDGGWWESGFSLLEKEAIDKQWGKAGMNHVVPDHI